MRLDNHVLIQTSDQLPHPVSGNCRRGLNRSCAITIAAATILPAEQQLAARFEVNRHTLRRAIDQLVERGWVQRRRGVGVLVLMRPIDYPLNARARFSQNLLEQGSHPTSEKLLSVLRPASSHVAEAFWHRRRRKPSFICAPCAGLTAWRCV